MVTSADKLSMDTLRKLIDKKFRLKLIDRKLSAAYSRLIVKITAV